MNHIQTNPAARLEMAVEMRRAGLIGRYELRKLLDGPMPFDVAMRLITRDFKEAVRAAVRRELKRRGARHG